MYHYENMLIKFWQRSIRPFQINQMLEKIIEAFEILRRALHDLYEHSKILESYEKLYYTDSFKFGIIHFIINLRKRFWQKSNFGSPNFCSLGVKRFRMTLNVAKTISYHILILKIMKYYFIPTGILKVIYYGSFHIMIDWLNEIFNNL